MVYFVRFVIFSIIVSAFISCSKEKLKAPSAAFLYVSYPQVNTTSAQGSNDHNITDTWVYVNDKFTGAYPLGSIIPVVGAGNAKITLFGGIKNNGISSTRQAYAFYDAFEFSQSFEAGKTYTVTPTYTYLSACNFHVVEGFEGAGLNFMSFGDSTYSLITDPARVYGGSGKSVFMSMSDAKPTAKMKTSSHITNFPATTATAYLELVYKCNQKIQVSMLCADLEERNVITINPSSEWNKIYVQLTEGIYNPTPYSYYDLIIKATKETATPEIYIDNIKIISL